jgi:hypothetical protein
MGIIREYPKKDGQSKYGDTHLPKEDKDNKKKIARCELCYVFQEPPE